MENLKSKKLNFQKVMLSMAIIMLVWAIFWYPFELFWFPKNLSKSVYNLVCISREYIRMAPAIFFLIYYKNSFDFNLKEMFSFKFNYKRFLVTLVIFVIYACMGSYFVSGQIHFDSNQIGFYNIFSWLSLGFCQELVFRGWSFNAFKLVASEKNAIILSSFFFSASHWFAHFFKFFKGTFNLSNFIQVTIFTFIFGIVMCFIMLKSKNKSIIPLAILHAVWDFLA